ncbi:MAG: hypothetical protein WDW38_006481 [Sanguina aurantia]
MSADPIPWKSSQLFVPQIDVLGPGKGEHGEPPETLAYADDDTRRTPRRQEGDEDEETDGDEDEGPGDDDEDDEDSEGDEDEDEDEDEGGGCTLGARGAGKSARGRMVGRVVGAGGTTTFLGVLGIRAPTAKHTTRKNPFVEGDDEPYSKYSRQEQEYFWKQSACKQKSITEEERTVRLLACNDIPMRFRVLSSVVHPSVKAMALKKLDGLRGSSSNDSGKSLQYIDALVRLPIGRYVTLPVGPTSPNNMVRLFLRGMQDRLDRRVHGHVEAKAHIIRLVAQYAMNPVARGLVIGFHGPPGCGKTELAKAVCECLELPFGFVALGGSNDSSVLAGHSYTYEGSSWGQIAEVLMRCGCMNSVLFFDELDKVSDSSGGKQVANLLIHLTDPTQNDKFTDRYFAGVDLDLSRSVVIFSYNNATTVNPVLRDRIVEVTTEGYTTNDKLIIVQKHLLPFTRTEFGYACDDLVMDDRVVRRIVDTIVEEAGVRNLKRAIRDIAGSINLQRLMEDDMQAPTMVTLAMVDKFVKSGRRDADRSTRATHMMYT